MYLPYSQVAQTDINAAPIINEETHLLSNTIPECSVDVCYPTFESMNRQVINPNEKSPLTPKQSYVKYILPETSSNAVAVPNSELCVELSAVERLTDEWIQERLNLISVLKQMIHALNDKQKEAATKKANGTATNLVGAALVIGGLLGSPITFGGSLVITGTGLLVVGGGTTEAIVASFKEWKHAKETAKQVQELLKKDTQMVNEIISKIYEIRSKHSDMDSCLISVGQNCVVNVFNFVQTLTNVKKEEFKNSRSVTNNYCVSLSLASLVIKGVIPFAALPVDLLILVQETKKASGKKQSKLAMKLLPVVESLKQQTSLATGLSIQ